MATSVVPVMTTEQIQEAVQSIRSSSIWGIRTDWDLEDDLRMVLEALVGHTVARVGIETRSMGGGFLPSKNPVVVITTIEGEKVEILLQTPIDRHVMINPKYKPK